MLPTPSTSHVSYNTIYEPAEDSFLLLDTLAAHAEKEWLRNRFPSSTPSPLVTEIGTGSGVVIAFLAANAKVIFARDDLLVLGVDVNVLACKATLTTVSKAITEQGSRTIYLGSLCADISSTLQALLVDVLIFNPPYVPTSTLPAQPSREVSSDGDAFETVSKLLELSYAGGVDGMEITNRLLDELPRVLSKRGVAYVLLCRQNRPEEVKQKIRVMGECWEVETVGRSGKVAGWEKLEVLRIWRT